MAGREDLFNESMRLGHSAAWDLQWNRAIEFYRKALAEFPNHANALNSLALALLETGQLDEALLVYKTASQANPEDPIPVEKCAEIYERLGKVKESIQAREDSADMYIRRKDAGKAVDNWRHIARLDPRNLASRTRLALTYERLGRTRDSALEYLSVASILASGGKIDRAKEAVQRSLAILPGDPEATRYLRLLNQGKKLPAPPQPRGGTAPLRMAQVQEYLRADADQPLEADDQLKDPETAAQGEALTILAGILFEEPKDNGKDQGLGMARIASGQTAELKPTSVIYRYLAQAIDLQTRGHKEQAVKEFTRAMETGLEHPAAHYNLAMLLKELGKIDEARKHLVASLGHPGLALGANLALGRLAKDKNDVREATRYLLQALKLADSLTVEQGQSKELNQFYETLLASQSEGDKKQLAKIVDSTLKFLSGPEWLKRLKQAREQLDKKAEGGGVLPIAEMLAVGDTDRVLRSMKRVDRMMDQGLYASALEESMLALDYAPTYLSLHRRMAEIQIAAGRPEAGYAKLSMVAETHRVRGEAAQAADVYMKILQFTPVDIPARTRLIDLLVQQDRGDEALTQSLELAGIYRDMAETDMARKTLANSLRLSQQLATGNGWSLKILHMMGDLDLSRLDQRRALRVYEQIRTLDPGDDKARVNLIDLNLRIGQEDQAAKELDSYLEFLVESGRGPEALNLLEEMAREHPGKQSLHARLAEAYKAAGRTADAIAQYDALGEVQLDAGQNEDAIRSIQAIIDLDPPDVEDYVELLRNLHSG
ncbi:MAG: tetratricopeptide repeat protein [Anaerolineales bacterium]